LAHAQGAHDVPAAAQTVDASQFSKAIAVTGGSFNADTQNEITQYFFETPAQDLPIALNLDRSRATGSSTRRSSGNRNAARSSKR